MKEVKTVKGIMCVACTMRVLKLPERHYCDNRSEEEVIPLLVGGVVEI